MATFGTITANGDTDVVFSEGATAFIASGTWDSGTFTVYIKSRGGTWKPINTDTAMTSDATGQYRFNIPGGHNFKATLSGAVSAPSLLWEFFGDRVRPA